MMRRIGLAIVASLVVVAAPALASAAGLSYTTTLQESRFLSSVYTQDENINLAASPEALSIAVLEEDSNNMSYANLVAYKTSHGNQFNLRASGVFEMSSAPVDPSGTTELGPNSIALVLSELNVETMIKQQPGDPSNVVFAAAIGTHWFIWRAGDSAVQTDHGRVYLTPSEMTVPSETLNSYVSYPLREVVTLLGGKVIYINQKIAIQFENSSPTNPPFYAP